MRPVRQIKALRSPEHSKQSQKSNRKVFASRASLRFVSTAVRGSRKREKRKQRNVSDLIRSAHLSKRRGSSQRAKVSFPYAFKKLFEPANGIGENLGPWSGDFAAFEDSLTEFGSRRAFLPLYTIGTRPTFRNKGNIQMLLT